MLLMLLSSSLSPPRRAAGRVAERVGRVPCWPRRSPSGCSHRTLTLRLLLQRRLPSLGTRAEQVVVSGQAGQAMARGAAVSPPSRWRAPVGCSRNPWSPRSAEGEAPQTFSFCSRRTAGAAPHRCLNSTKELLTSFLCLLQPNGLPGKHTPRTRGTYGVLMRARPLAPRRINTHQEISSATRHQSMPASQSAQGGARGTHKSA